MNYRTFKLAFLALFSVALFSCSDKNIQTTTTKDDPVLMTVGGTDVKLSEFEYVYRKNNSKPSETPLDEYLELYTNFRLKVKEAEALGMDTSAKFLNEFNGYKKELTKPYLVDKDVDKKLLNEAYERMQTDVKASHILIKSSENDLPADTLKAYQKAVEARNRVVNGEDFGVVAKEMSDDPSAKQNNGSLGYFSALRMVYPFENAAYNTKVGEVSNPVKTRFGYHVVKVEDQRKARGEIRVAHIMIRTKDEMTETQLNEAKAKAEEIYAKVKAGEDFAELARKHSDDKTTAPKGGELPAFTPGRMVPEFEEASYALTTDGEISTPIKTDYGWHIIKRIEKKPIPSFEDAEADLKAKISRDSRSQKSKEAVLEKIKKDYNLKVNKASKEAFYTAVDSSIYTGKWTTEKASSLNGELFNLGGKTYGQQDFAGFIQRNQTKRKLAGVPILVAVNRLFDEYLNVELLRYEEAMLPSKYPDYKNLLQEYRDGILLFNLTEEKVWGKSVRDTAGLSAFYEDHKGEFMWEERLEASIYTCNNLEVAKQVRKLLTEEVMTGKLSNDSILKLVNKESKLNLKIEDGKFQKGDRDILGQIAWETGLSNDISGEDGQVSIVLVKTVLPPTNKTLKEARGLVANKYQDYLMDEWITELKAKYPVQVNEEVLSKIK